ncbi:MAG: hypothetical protein ABFD69_01145 [Candidatus Sumerlaeia bacterium]
MLLFPTPGHPARPGFLNSKLETRNLLDLVLFLNSSLTSPRMPNIPPIDDLENLSATGAMLEGILRQWVQEITECSPPDIVTFAEAIDFFARLTAIRKTLIKLSRPTKPRPDRPSPNPEKRSRAADLPSSPVDLPEPDIPQIRSLPDVPLDRIRPELEAISAAFADGGLPIPDCKIPESDPSDRSAPCPGDNSPIRNPQSEIRNPSPPLPRDFEIRNPQSEIRNPIPRRFG